MLLIVIFYTCIHISWKSNFPFFYFSFFVFTFSFLSGYGLHDRFPRWTWSWYTRDLHDTETCPGWTTIEQKTANRPTGDPRALLSLVVVSARFCIGDRGSMRRFHRWPFFYLRWAGIVANATWFQIWWYRFDIYRKERVILKFKNNNKKKIREGKKKEWNDKGTPKPETKTKRKKEKKKTILEG